MAGLKLQKYCFKVFDGTIEANGMTEIYPKQAVAMKSRNHVKSLSSKNTSGAS